MPPPTATTAPAKSRMAKKRPNSKKRPAGKVTAETLATKQRDISVSEFFAKNRHLLGFDNPRKALLTTVKEAVDNALDACEEADILPDILVEITALPESGDDRFRVVVQDNGPGIVQKQIEHIFGKLLYGSKFHRLKMSRGQQGIGISAAGMYGLITTGKPVKIISKTGKRKPSHEVVLKMDTSKNRADIVSNTEHPEDDPLFPHGHGTRVEIELVGKYLKGDRSVDQYVQLTAIANPHASFTYTSPATASAPNGETTVHERSVHELPDPTEEIKPHPHGIELGTLISMLERTEEKQLGGFFSREFCRVSPKVGQKVADESGLTTRTWIKNIDHAGAEKLYKNLQSARVMAPPTNCLSPIGVRTLLKGLEAGLDPDFIAASSRPPTVYRGRPFVIEAGVAFGGNLPGDEPAKVYRFANRVPLLYQQSACASFKAVLETSWKNYGLQQPRGALPVGPLVVMIHMASVWVPFTSESKEAIADDDEIRKEMRLALQECGRKLGSYMRRRQRMKRAGERRDVFQRYIGEVAKACASLTGDEPDRLYAALLETAQRKTFEMDQELDEEGRVVKKGRKKPTADRLADDEGVYIKDRPPEGADPDDLAAIAGPSSASERHANLDTEDDDDDPDAHDLFGDAAPPPAPKKKPTSKKTKKKVIRKKKVTKKRPRGR
jgi:DNA topoisomerase-6 subunit B